MRGRGDGAGREEPPHDFFFLTLRDRPQSETVPENDVRDIVLDATVLLLLPLSSHLLCVLAGASRSVGFLVPSLLLGDMGTWSSVSRFCARPSGSCSLLCSSISPSSQEV